MSSQNDPPIPEASSGPAPTESGDERRRYDRHEVEGIHGNFLFTTDARIVNISLDGLAVETHSYLQIGRHYALKLQSEDRVLPLQAKVVWCTLVRTSRSDTENVLPVYRAGIQFEEILSEAATDIYRLIEKNAVISLEKRLFGRFKLQPERAASFDCEASFTVRKISFSGMLIESDIVPEIDATFEMEIRFDGQQLQTMGRVVHVQRIGDADGEPRARIGVEFVSLDEQAREKLEEFIRAQLA